jgi:S-adenosylmethionine hydrolase
LKPEITSPQAIVAHVLHVDHFGNLMLDVRADRLPHRPVFEIAGRVIGGLSGTYAGAAPGELVAYVGSTHDLVEIAVCNGDAAQATGAAVGAQVLIRRRASAHGSEVT